MYFAKTNIINQAHNKRMRESDEMHQLYLKSCGKTWLASEQFKLKQKKTLLLNLER